jgi:hypothetical protein
MEDMADMDHMDPTAAVMVVVVIAGMIIKSIGGGASGSISKALSLSSLFISNGIFWKN